MTNEITVWYRQYKDKSGRCYYEHNHIQDGHIDSKKPIGHPAWKAYKWLKDFTYLKDGIVL